MSRRSLLAAGAATIASAVGCAGSDRRAEQTFDGEVIVIGAGPAGMTAAHRLLQNGVPTTLLEASGEVGGRIRHTLDFTDFPIPLGAEWVHVEAGILAEIVADPSVDIATELVGYDSSARLAYFEDGELEWFAHTDADLKFVDSSWLDFYQTYLLPGIADRIVYHSEVKAIDYAGDRIQVIDAAGVTRDRKSVV